MRSVGMDKRYQVFVSSTFADLKDERSNVIQTLMEMDCIPAGMELFPALDEEQFEFIKKVIDDSDYYLLIIGGRYGSLSDEGISYTEMEYDYAISKGIKVIALVHGSPEKLAVEKVEMDSEAQEKLQVFKTKATTNRLVKFWSDAKELSGLVALSLPKTIKTYPAIGWIRGNEATDNTELLKQLNELRKEKDELKKQVQELQKNKSEMLDLAQDEDETFISIKCDSERGRGIYNKRWKESVTWSELFKIIGPKILKPCFEPQVYNALAKSLASKQARDFNSAIIDLNDLEKIKIQFLALDYIELIGGSATNIYWNITSKGQRYLTQILSVKRDNAE